MRLRTSALTSASISARRISETSVFAETGSMLQQCAGEDLANNTPVTGTILSWQPPKGSIVHDLDAKCSGFAGDSKRDY